MISIVSVNSIFSFFWELFHHRYSHGKGTYEDETKPRVSEANGNEVSPRFREFNENEMERDGMPLRHGPHIAADGHVALAYNDETRARGKLTVALSHDEVREPRAGTWGGDGGRAHRKGRERGSDEKSKAGPGM